MNIIHCIVPSFNRAAQLDLLLKSIKQNTQNLFRIYVVFKSTNNQFANGYMNLINYDRKEKIVRGGFFKEIKSFKKEVDEILVSLPEDDLVCFMMDDDIIYRPLEFSFEDIKNVFNEEMIGCLSLRTGSNVVIQTYHKNDRLPIFSFAYFNDFIRWNPTNYPVCTYNYPFSLDGHIFRVRDLVPHILKINYDNPNLLEATLAGIPFNRDMVAPINSVLTGLPLNAVSGWNPAGYQFPKSIEELNDRFLRGDRISLDLAMRALYNCNCSHAEIELSWETQ